MKYQVSLHDFCTRHKSLLVLEMSSVDCEAVKKMINDIGVVINDEPYTAPPGEEGFDISHEGGKYEAFEGLSEQVASLSHV
jgi:hypothetical protein